MNDPFDSLMYPWIEINTRKFTEENVNVMRIFSESQKFYKIRSFTVYNKEDNQPFKRTVMWSHYADEHRGFCVVYSLSPNMRLTLADDSYQVLDRISYEENSINLASDLPIDGKALLFQKSKEWAYEEEYRLLMYDPKIKNDYYQLPLDSESKVYAIIFGINCSKDTKKIVRSILNGQPSVLYKDMVMNPNDIYNLNIVDSNA